MLVPDRPGGRIAWQGVEVSSIGAGLPLIVVGIVAIAISGGGAIGDSNGNGKSAEAKTGTIATLECPDDLASKLSAERIATVESGANAQIIAGPLASKTDTFGLRFTDGGETIGAMTLTFFPASALFKVQSFVDADCETAQVLSLEPGVGALGAIRNWGTVRTDLGGNSYLFNVGSGVDTRVNFGRFVQ